MFLDTSAIIEYFLEGPEYERISAALATGSQFFVSPTVVFEATTVLAGKRRIEVDDATKLVLDFLTELNAEILPATRDTALAALDAFSRYGKGRHPARLNFGDCFSYAGAKASGAALLYVGEDFRRTDLA
ncbi:type II toxin-antitoxin system VapC family toxin [Rhizobium sp. AG855]|uniref:type II toxin-antitoxin system VapC family toxin n=1 Tax=Rhizobium sp. AG855 TaxID=2183898 RepID=UPI000E762699|nr:type II toxin-antitoxin system VapC family toxin [Rhizobium sp. AG855]RKE85327.1 ribonuclease VapC [Rhizobium sp. AG855]